MVYDQLIEAFARFGLALLVGVLIGLEREQREDKVINLGLRDYVLFSLLGAFSAFLADQYDAVWVIGLGFVGVMTLVLSAYWADRQHGPGVTSELAALITFLLGVLILSGLQALAIALTIVTLAVLFLKAAIKRWTKKISAGELQAVLLFLTISFIVLPVLPNLTLDHLASFKVGTIAEVDRDQRRVKVKTGEEVEAVGASLEVFDRSWRYLGNLEITDSRAGFATSEYKGAYFDDLAAGQMVRGRLDIEPLYEVLAAVNPYRIWLIVVLVSFVSFLGYVLIRALGSSAGIGLTGLVGGLVSSTVTTLSFARRSRENTIATPLFAAAIILASSVMFPRLILEIGVFNVALMKSISVPLIAMGLTGLTIAVVALKRFNSSAPDADTAESVTFSNPFSLKSAISFAAVFAAILGVTRLATTYLGGEWLPLVAVLSGLTDADAIAFSISNLQRNSLISLDWASFNLVLGALSNTFLKLGLVFTLGSRMLFRQVLWGFLAVAAVGMLTMLFYYDLSAMS